MTAPLKELPDDLPEGRKRLAEAVRSTLGESDKSLRKIARDAHVSPAHLSLIASGKRRPTETTMENILRATAPAKPGQSTTSAPARRYLTPHWVALLTAALSAVVALLAHPWQSPPDEGWHNVDTPPWSTVTPEPPPPALVQPPDPDLEPSPSPGSAPALFVGQPLPLYENPYAQRPTYVIPSYQHYVQIEGWVQCKSPSWDGRYRYRTVLIDPGNGQFVGGWFVDEEAIRDAEKPLAEIPVCEGE
ncbi:helix-turn-helix domain-containing protein [Streptomyces sp. NPDC056468]|uniref:helix-turn-helix domain-containing protein n=1 Tax=Streptomyces sp. NPDC056468 TaxID=3345830 RepID=UPI00369F1ADD